MLPTSRFLPLFLLLLLGGCAGQEPWIDEASFFRDEIEVGRHRIPLPEGEWRLVAWQARVDAHGVPWVELQLLNVDAERRELVGGVLISANLQASPRPLDLGKVGRCDEPGYFRGGGRSGAQACDCWVVSYFLTAVGRQSGKVAAKTLAWLHLNRIRHSNVALYTAYRFGSASDMVSVHYWFNPEYQGQVSFTPATPWHESPWHPDFYAGDARRAAYVEKLRNWGLEWYGQVKAGFAVN